MRPEGLPMEEDRVGRIDHSFLVDVDKGFEKGEMLFQEVLNKWIPIGAAGRSKKPERLKRLEPLPLYEDYFKEKAEEDHKRAKSEESALENALFTPHKAAYIMECSDPHQVGRYDALVAQYNADLERIKNEGDFDAALRYEERAEELVREKKTEEDTIYQ